MAPYISHPFISLPLFSHGPPPLSVIAFGTPAPSGFALLPALSPTKNLNDDALLQRLRRVCQRSEKTKKLQVDPQVHDLWVSYADERAKRLALAKVLAATDFQKESCLC
jgi:hypothetical protein